MREGQECPTVPPAYTPAETHKAGYLSQHVKVARYLRGVEDGVAEYVWRIAEGAGVSKHVAERALVSMGLKIVYINAKHYNPKARGMRRGVVVSQKAIDKWVQKVREYKEKMAP